MIYFLHEYFIIVYYLLTEDHYLPRRFSETLFLEKGLLLIVIYLTLVVL